MKILHIALQGCLRATDVEYGVTNDTGGHIRYLLDLVDAVLLADRSTDVTIVTRRFYAPFAPYAAAAIEEAGPRLRVVRIASDQLGYLPMAELHGELPSLQDSLEKYLLSLRVLPDVIHAHYGEAAALALAMRNRFGIPFIYTPHSYARVTLSLRGGVPGSSMANRIAREDTALATANMVTASSVHEAEQQASLSPSYRTGAMKVLPPGVDIEAFDSARISDSIRDRLERPLVDKAKPVVLAIARPVWKKNLRGVVRAFAVSRRLRERANLIIIAGSRGRVADLEPEARGVIRELLELVHEARLDGVVSMPLEHTSNEVPSIFRYCYEQRGVFASPALSEPYGLTLLEAAAAGVPTVGSTEGAPTEVVTRLGHGTVVSPDDPEALASALLDILDDDDRWITFSTAGRQRVRPQTWRTHAAEYLRCLRGLVGARVTPSRSVPGRTLLVCDIDGTLVGDTAASSRFRRWLGERPQVVFAVATGRRLHDALETLRLAGLPSPDVVICSVGSEVFWRAPDGITYLEDEDRQTHLLLWPRERLRERLDKAGVVGQGLEAQRPSKLGYYVKNATDFERAQEAVLGLPHTMIWSHGMYLDVLPQGVNKASAVQHVGVALGVAAGATVVAGDSANDREMLAHFPNAVLVANWTDGLRSDPALSHVYVSSRPFADGVIDGANVMLERVRRSRPYVLPS
ncbi:HAD family hydrolase [Clavibacter michiganensis]|nr:HAD family hydrolase [Clavibacter michiganensis]